MPPPCASLGAPLADCLPSLTLASLLAVWYASSALTSLSTKEILRVFPYPVTLALTQQAVAVTLGWGSLRSERSRMSMVTDWRLHARTLPITSVMVVALISYRWALMAASVSFIHTVKTLSPVFAIPLSRAVLDEKLPLAHYVAVVPIVLGVMLTSITEAEFTAVGFAAGVISTGGQALQAVIAKRLLLREAISKAELFAMAAFQAFCLLLPICLGTEAWRIEPLLTPRAQRVACWLLLNGGCSFVNQYVALSVLDAMASPISYSLANVMKRATVITIAMTYAAKPVTALHLCGISLSVIGAFGYQQVGLHCPAEAAADSGASGGAALSYELLPLQDPRSPAKDGAAPPAS